MTLAAARISTIVDTFTYYSKSYNIITEWDGGGFYWINVYDEKGNVLEYEKIRGEVLDIEIKFEELKTKYILK